jgi:hypothetical protein
MDECRCRYWGDRKSGIIFDAFEKKCSVPVNLETDRGGLYASFG